MEFARDRLTFWNWALIQQVYWVSGILYESHGLTTQVSIGCCCCGSRRVGQDLVHCHLYDVMQGRSTAFPHGGRLLCVSWRVFSMKRLQENPYRPPHTTTCLVWRAVKASLFALCPNYWANHTSISILFTVVPMTSAHFTSSISASSMQGKLFLLTSDILYHEC